MKEKLKALCAKVKSAFVSGHAISSGIKYIPVIGVILLTIHTALLILDIHEVVTVCLAEVLLILFLILLSTKFQFCALHKALILYMSLMTGCICIQKLCGFGESLMGTRWLMFIVGVLLIALAIYKRNEDECGKQ